MNTVFIWNDMGDCDPPLYFVVEGDYRHLHGVYINLTNDHSLVDQLDDLVYNKAGEFQQERLDEFPVDAVINGAFVVHAGFVL